VINYKLNTMKYSITKKGELLFKVDTGVLNYTQRNNLYKYYHPKTNKLLTSALSTCNTTSYCEAAEINRFVFPSGNYVQPEDNFAEFMMTDKRVLEYYKKTMPAMYAAFERGDNGCYCPNEVHTVLAYGFNRWMECPEDKPVVYFRDSCKIPVILTEIIVNDSAVVMSGTFPYKYSNGIMGEIGHINVLVGIQYSAQQLEENKIDLKSPASISSLAMVLPEILIFDDPYGSMHKNFQSGTENDVIVKAQDFLRYYKPLRDMTMKYAHIFKKAGAVI